MVSYQPLGPRRVRVAVLSGAGRCSVLERGLDGGGLVVVQRKPQAFSPGACWASAMTPADMRLPSAMRRIDY